MSISFRATENGFTHVCAHRGYCLRYPENTVLAFERARLAGATTCEIDLVLTRDAEAIVLHDATLDRTTDGNGFAADHDLAEIRSLNAAARFDGRFADGVSIPTFEAVVLWAKKASMGLVVEMKERERPELLASRVLSVLRDTDGADNVMLLSFNHVDLARIKEREPRIRTEAIVHARHVDIVGLIKACGADSVLIELDMFAAEDAIALHEAGLGNRVHLPRPDELAPYWMHGRDYRARIGEWLAAGLIDSLSGDDVPFLRKLVDQYPIVATGSQLRGIAGTMTQIGGDAVALDYKRRRVLLKWHMLRRAPDDPPFSPNNLKVGLALGASMEVDIRLLADDNWICLHEAVLDEETSGEGPVAAIDIETARRLRVTGGDFPPPLLADLAATLSTASPGTRLQLDLKEHISAISPVAIASFAAAVSPVARYCLLSGDDWQAVRRLGAAVPELRQGFDPYKFCEKREFDRASDIEAFVTEVLEIAPTADAFYLHHALVTAALTLGHNSIEQLKANGAFVDVWTLDPTTPNIGQVLPACIAAGADQITTNDPPGLARLWRNADSTWTGGS